MPSPEDRAPSAQALSLAEALIEGTDEAMVLVGKDGVPHAIRDGEPLASDLDVSLEDILADPGSFVSRDELGALTDLWKHVAAGPGAARHATFSLLDPDGHPHAELDVSATNLEHTPLAAIVVRVRVARASQLPPPPAPSEDRWPADPQTQKPQFLDILQKAVDRKIERVWDAPTHARSVARDRRCDYAVVLLNVDRFGLLRGSFGEADLRTLLNVAAERLRRALRTRDAVAHIGGAELAMFLDGVADADQAARVTDAYVRILEDRFTMSGESVSLSPIVGIATSERRYNRADDVLRDAAAAASRAMRKARTGRQAYVTGIRLEDRRHVILAADLREALKSGDVFELYQPIIRLHDRLVVGFEALCRWRHPSLELVPPNEFIPVAEEVGMIRTLGDRVLRHACIQATRWNAGDKEPVSVSVNVSAAEIVGPSFARDVTVAIRETGVAPAQLVIEITESALLEDFNAAKANMSELRDQGVQFALDDFGTGYSSLSYLVELPFNKLKIDRTLVAAPSAERRKVVRAVVALAHELGLDVVAEGIETDEQCEHLVAVRCDYGQGYLFGAAMATDKADELLKAR